MIFVFEDDGNDLLSALFRKAYPESVSARFIYLQGIGNAKERIEQLLEDTEDSVTLFMDLVPDNLDLRSKYSTLRLISRQNNFRLVIIPIVCLEFCFIESLSILGVIPDSEIISRCLNKQPYYDLIKRFNTPEYIKNFEKFCKAIIKEYCLPCISTDSQSVDYGKYYHNDCNCISSNCRRISIIDKSFSFVKRLPCFPAGSFMKDVNNLEDEQVWNIHRLCIESLNGMIDIYRNDSSVDKNKLCKKFVAIK